MKKKEIEGIIWLIVIGVPILLIFSFVDAVGLPIFIIISIIVIVLIIKYKEKKRKERIAYLTKKYKNEELVNKIMEGYFWQGQTAEQLLDSLGNPEDTDEKILKTKKKEIWKYNSDGVDRYRLRIILENDIVVGWKKR